MDTLSQWKLLHKSEAKSTEPVFYLNTMAHSSARTFGILLFYSLLMFSLPFFAFFGTKSVLRDHLHVTGFAQTAWSVASSVVVVNLIIFAYVWNAFHDNTIDEDVTGVSEGQDESDKKQD